MINKIPRTVLMMAGGTGGHIFPALAIADEIQQQQCKVVWLGTKRGMESRLIPEKNYPIEYIDIGGLRGKGFSQLLTMPYRLIKAVIQTFAVFKRIKPDLTIGMGGFVTGPGGLVSWLLGKPLIIHEQNAISGLSNNLLSLFAQQRLCAFPGAYKDLFLAKFYRTKNCVVTGNPIRKDILAIRKKPSLLESKNNLNILIIGGSLGAAKINQVVPQTLQLIQQQKPSLYSHYCVKHQCGKGKAEQVRKAISGDFFATNSSIKISYEIEEFISDMASVYQWADIVICRAGALTISELTAVGITSILIPLPSAVGDHQTENAKYISENKAGFLLAQSDLDANNLKQIINQCNHEKISKMSASAKRLAKPNATTDVVKRCLLLLNDDTSSSTTVGQNNE